MENAEKKIIARIHLDYDLIDNIFKVEKKTDKEISELISNHLEEMRIDINSKVSSFLITTKLSSKCFSPLIVFNN